MEPPERETYLETDGGRVEVWSEDFQLFKDTNIGAALITLEEDGLALPRYTDAHHIFYVLEGCARVELYYPWSYPANVRTVGEGDILVVPRGWVHWWYNEGKGKLRVFAVADTSAGPKPGLYNNFFLAGASKEEYGGILHGFSKDVLSRAWDVSEDTVAELLESQSEVGIIKLKEKLNLPKPREDNKACNGGPCIGDFRYNIDAAESDYRVEDGGELTLLNCYKLPVLKKVGFGAIRVMLKPGAVVAPNWSPNAHAIGIVTRGKGRIQATTPDGESALDMDLKEGDLFLIPRFYPTVKLAEEDNHLEYLLITTVSNPTQSFLAGMGSVFAALPTDVRRAALAIDKELEEKICERRRGDAVILPPAHATRRMKKPSFSAHFQRWIGDAKEWVDDLYLMKNA